MKKFLYLLLMSTLILTSCGGKKKTKEIKFEPLPPIFPKEVSINGDLGKCFEVIEKKYPPIFNDNFIISNTYTFELKRTDVKLPFEIDGARNYGTMGSNVDIHFGFGINVYDSLNNIIMSINPKEGDCNSNELISLLKLKEGETSTLQFNLYTCNDLTPSTFQLTSEWEKVEHIEVAAEEEDTEQNTEPSNADNVFDKLGDELNEGINSLKNDFEDIDEEINRNVKKIDEKIDRNVEKIKKSTKNTDSSKSDKEKIDDLLDDYEVLIDKLIVLYEEKGEDLNFKNLAKMTDIMRDASDIQLQIADIDTELTFAQSRRLSKLAAKLMEATEKLK